MKIIIETIPHEQQRYSTCGDWQFIQDDLHIKVSDMSNLYYELLVGFHELIEAILCMKDGITEQDVDEWDMSHPDLDEPGESPNAPYHKQHVIATVGESVLCGFLGINWKEYEKTIDEL